MKIFGSNSYLIKWNLLDYLITKFLGPNSSNYTYEHVMWKKTAIKMVSNTLKSYDMPSKNCTVLKREIREYFKKYK